MGTFTFGFIIFVTVLLSVGIMYIMQLRSSLRIAERKINSLSVDLLLSKKVNKEFSVLVDRQDKVIKLLQEKLHLSEQTSRQFTQSELQTLINLCHPDKHGGKQSAVTMTQILLKMRK